MPKKKSSTTSRSSRLPYMNGVQLKKLKALTLEALNEALPAVVVHEVQPSYPLTLKSHTEQMVINAMKAGHWHAAVRYLQTAKCMLDVRPLKVKDAIASYRHTPAHYPVHDIIRYVQWLEHLMGIKT